MNPANFAKCPRRPLVSFRVIWHQCCKVIQCMPPVPSLLLGVRLLVSAMAAAPQAGDGVTLVAVAKEGAAATIEVACAGRVVGAPAAFAQRCDRVQMVTTHPS